MTLSQAKLQRDLWRNWPDRIRKTLGMARSEERLETCDTGMSHLGQTGCGQRALSFAIPASGALLSKHRLDPATQRESLIETLFEKISVVFQGAGPSARSKETNYAGRGSFRLQTTQVRSRPLCPNTAMARDKLAQDAVLGQWRAVEGRPPEPVWCPGLPP